MSASIWRSHASAMKMQTTIYAAADGVVSEINVQVGENVESKDLLAKLRV